MNKNKGFSLIELLIAVTILTIVMIMVTQFMVSSSRTLMKTKKNLNIQTESMEIGEQISDMLMQATYIRVRSQDGVLYKVKNELQTVAATGKRKKREATNVGSMTGDLVVDNYPNYIKPTTASERDIILDMRTTGGNMYSLLDKDKNTYPLAGDTDSTVVHSFRLLESGANRKYVIPKYIYLRYQKKVGSEVTSSVIYYFNENQIYMVRRDIDGTEVADGFDEAKSLVDAKTGKEGLLTNSVIVQEGSSYSDCYFSADTYANTVFLDMNFANEKYKEYTYNYAEAVLLRNTNVLTVPPQKRYQVK